MNNIDFYAEIYKSDSDDEYDNLCTDTTTAGTVGDCMITHTPLQNSYVTLECGHMFNYDAIFNDIYNHKKQFHTLETSRLKEHQIRCPYCRNIQNTLLPHYPGKRKVSGVNSLAVQIEEPSLHMRDHKMFWYNYKQYAKGYCCHDIANVDDVKGTFPIQSVTCPDTMVIYNDIDERPYCKSHTKERLSLFFAEKDATVKKEVANIKKEITAIAREEKALAKKKASMIEKQENLQDTASELREWYREKMFAAQAKPVTKNMVNNAPKNVVVSSSIDISGTSTSSTELPQKKPMNRCIAIMSKHKVRCTGKSISGSTYCSRHKKLLG